MSQPEPALRKHTFEHAEVQAAVQPWVEMECYQLGRGGQVGRLENLDLGRQQIVRETQTVGVQKLAYIPRGLCTISCCRLDPDSDADDRFNDHRAGGRQDPLFFLPGDIECDIYVPAGAQTDYVLFELDEFLHGARALDPARWERAPTNLISIPGTRQSDLETVVNTWLRLSGLSVAESPVPDAELLRRLLLQDILGIVTATPAGDLAPQPLDRAYAFHTCRKARAFMEESLAEDCLPTIAEVCRRVGVSERALQYAFHAYIGLSPLVYLKICRLNRVRAALARPAAASTTVTEVAVRHGFLHLGGFARDFRLHFGETPSAVLQQGRRRAGW